MTYYYCIILYDMLREYNKIILYYIICSFLYRHLSRHLRIPNVYWTWQTPKYSAPFRGLRSPWSNVRSLRIPVTIQQIKFKNSSRHTDIYSITILITVNDSVIWFHYNIRFHFFLSVTTLRRVDHTKFAAEM